MRYAASGTNVNQSIALFQTPKKCGRAGDGQKSNGKAMTRVTMLARSNNHELGWMPLLASRKGRF